MRTFTPRDFVVGLEFKSVTFSAVAKVVAIRGEQNECDVEMTPSDYHAWVHKDWDLKHTIQRLSIGEFTVILRDTTNYSVI